MVMLLEGPTVTLGERRFPVAGVVCPPHEGYPDETIEHRRLSISSKLLHVPAENGALFALDVNGDGTVGLHIYAPVCHEIPENGGDPPMWLPVALMLDTRTRSLRPWHVRGGEWTWARADPEWVGEAIERWSTWPVVDLPDGPRVTLERQPDRKDPS